MTLGACALAGLLLATSPPAAAAPAFGLSNYLALAREYRTGGGDRPVRALRDWLSAEIEGAIADLRRRPEAICEPPLRPAEVDVRDVEAAIVLHAHLGLHALLSRSPVVAGFHLSAAEHLFLWLQQVAKQRHADRPEMVTREGLSHSVGPSRLRPRIGERDFYLALTGACLGLGTLSPATRYAEAGLRRLPTDGEMLLLAGAVKAAWATERSAVGTAGEARRGLEAAERLLRGALAVDGHDTEARLRLGYVYLLQGRATEAEGPLETVTKEASEAPLRYLAWLFLARLREGRGDLAGAAEAYERAVASQPGGQAAYLGLAWLRDRQTGPSEAHALLGTYLRGDPGVRSTGDPWAGYILGPRRLTQPQRQVDRLRALLAAP